MKYLFVFALIAVASAKTFFKPAVMTQDQLEIQQIIDTINNPSTNPATAAALEEMLHDFLGFPKPDEQPIAGPAIVPVVDGASPIAVGPAIVGFPTDIDNGALSFPEVAPVSPIANPAVVPVIDATPAAVASASPLVQIVLNINQGPSNSPAASPAIVPVVADEISNVDEVHFAETAFDAVNIVDQVVDAVNVVDQVVDTVNVVDQVVDTVNVVDQVVLPSPAITLPEILN